MKRKLFYVVFGFMLGATVSPAQESVTKENREVRAFNIEGNPVWETPLQDNHIAFTTEALLAALRHPVSGVRSAAAHELAARMGKDAVPSILSALAAETFPGTRIQLACAASKLGAEEGVAALKSMCGDPSWSAVLRMSAAWAMLVAGREDCLGNVMDVVRVHDDIQATNQALNLFTWFKHVPAREMQEVRNLVRMSLRSDNVLIKRQASYVLRQWADSPALEDLQSAIAGERDEAVREAMIKDLKALEEKRAGKYRR
jgi:HEAT repeat protein